MRAGATEVGVVSGGAPIDVRARFILICAYTGKEVV